MIDCRGVGSAGKMYPPASLGPLPADHDLGEVHIRSCGVINESKPIDELMKKNYCNKNFSNGKSCPVETIVGLDILL